MLHYVEWMTRLHKYEKKDERESTYFMLDLWSKMGVKNLRDLSNFAWRRGYTVNFIFKPMQKE